MFLIIIPNPWLKPHCLVFLLPPFLMPLFIHPKARHRNQPSLIPSYYLLFETRVSEPSHKWF